MNNLIAEMHPRKNCEICSNPWKSVGQKQSLNL
jgi:hypothetical protein